MTFFEFATQVFQFSICSLIISSHSSTVAVWQNELVVLRATGTFSCGNHFLVLSGDLEPALLIMAKASRTNAVETGRQRVITMPLFNFWRDIEGR